MTLTATRLLPVNLPDHDLLSEIARAAADERHATAHLIALLVEMDARRLYLGEGFSSLFAYCTQALHLSEHAAYNRIEAARAVRRFPIVLDLIGEGAVTLTAVRLLAPHLTPENHGDVLARARYKNKRDIELLVATLHPQSDVLPVIRKLPTPVVRTALTLEAAGAQPVTETAAQVGPPAEVARNAIITASPAIATTRDRSQVAMTPIAPERYKIQFTTGRDTYEKLRRAQALLRHTVPDGNPAVIVDRALTLLLTELERTKIGHAKRPRAIRAASPKSRHVPAAVRRVVWRRDDGRCAFVGAQGRCAETGFLEYHHVVPFAEGGTTALDNLELRCRAHNQYEAERWFGSGRMSEFCTRREGDGG